MVEGVDAAMVRNAEGAQDRVPQAHTGLQDGVHVLIGGGAHGYDVQRLPEDGELDAVDDEAVDIPHHHGLLPQAFHQLPHFLDVFRAGFGAGDDLAQGQQVRGVQPVLAHEALGVFAGFGDLRDVEAGGVGAQEGLLGGDLADLPEEALLDVHALYGRFHHQTTVPEDLLILSEMDAGHGGVGFGLGDEALLHHGLLIQSDKVLAVFDTGLKGIIAPSLIPRQRVYLAQGRTHDARPRHHYFIVVHCLTSYNSTIF